MTSQVYNIYGSVSRIFVDAFRHPAYGTAGEILLHRHHKHMTVILTFMVRTEVASHSNESGAAITHGCITGSAFVVCVGKVTQLGGWPLLAELTLFPWPVAATDDSCCSIAQI